MHGRYVKGADARARSVSWHYSVDSREIRQHLPDTERGWHAGSGNVNSIGIELCVNSDGNWAQTKRRGQQLIAYLMKKWGITLANVETHRAQTGKNCPANLLREGFAAFKAGIGVVPTEEVASEYTKQEAVIIKAENFQWASGKNGFEDILRRHGNKNENDAYKNGSLTESDAFGVVAKALLAQPSETVPDAHKDAWAEFTDRGIVNGERPNHP